MKQPTPTQRHEAERLVTHLGEAMRLAYNLRHPDLGHQIGEMARTAIKWFPHTATAFHRAPGDDTVRCLYCGANDDICETRVTVDDRTDEYALQCGDCGGVWAQ